MVEIYICLSTYSISIDKFDEAEDLKAAIFAGGKGVRLEPLTELIPKPLVRVAGVPLIERAALTLESIGVEEIIMVIRHNFQIEEYFKKKPIATKIFFIRKNTKNNVEAFFSLRERLLNEKEQFLILLADLVFDPRTLKDFVEFGKKSKADMVVGVSETEACDFRVIVGQNNVIMDVGENLRVGLYGTGMYICSPILLDQKCNNEQSFENLIRCFVRKGYKALAYNMRNVYDIDTSEDLSKAEDFLQHREMT